MDNKKQVQLPNFLVLSTLYRFRLLPFFYILNHKTPCKMYYNSDIKMTRLIPLLLILFLACGTEPGNKLESNQIIINAVPDLVIDEYESDKLIQYSGVILDAKVVENNTEYVFSDTSRYLLLINNESDKAAFLERVGKKEDGEKITQNMVIAKDSAWYFVSYY
jgi:hypothetical protein